MSLHALESLQHARAVNMIWIALQGATVAIMAGTAGAASLGTAAEEQQQDPLPLMPPMKRKAKKTEELQ